jgi:hypothetical protein
MKKGFPETNKIVGQHPKDKPVDGGECLGWDFRTPQYDQRSSGFVKAGTWYGKGINQPVGHFDPPKLKVDVLPYGAKAIYQQIPHGNEWK